MSAHEGVSCDACGKSNFRAKRYKCLICYDYDLCSTCYEQGETSSHHASEHPMQCILTRQDFDFYYHGERCTSDQPQSLTCPFCGDMGLALPFSTDSSSNSSLQHTDLFHHLQMKHADEAQSTEVICPICAAMANGEPNLVTADLLAHIANDHQHTQVQTPSSAGGAPNPYSRQSSSNRDFEFSGGSSARPGFRRGPLRAPSRRGGIGRGGGAVSQHFVVDTSSVNGGSDPIADLLTQLSTVRRLAAANNSSSLSSSSNTINLQTLTRQQYERERLRTTGRSQQQQQQSHHSQQTSSSTILPSVENDFFDSLFASALCIDSSPSSNTSHQTWAQIVAQQQQQQPTSTLPTFEPQQQSHASTIKTSGSEPDPSLLRKLCDESSSSLLPNNPLAPHQKRKSDFVHNVLLSSLICPLNDNAK